MMPTCSLDVVDVFSPLRQNLESLGSSNGGDSNAGTSADEVEEPEEMHLFPPVSVDDRVFFLSSLYRIHNCAARMVHSLPPAFRLSVELALLVAALIQLIALVALHSLYMPSPTAAPAAKDFSSNLTAALHAPGMHVELVRVDVQVPRPQFCADLEGKVGWVSSSVSNQFCGRAFGENVRCEFAAERALLTLPAYAREKAYQAGNSSETALSVSMRIAPPNTTLFSFLHALPGFTASVLARQILAAVVWGPLHTEVRNREAASNASMMMAGYESSSLPPSNDTQSAEARSALQQAWAANRWSFFDGWTDSSKLGADSNSDQGDGSAALGYFSCQGESPASLQPLRRLAELLHRCTEWWLFKAVWALSTSVLALSVGVVVSFAVRAAFFGFFRIYMAWVGDKRGGVDEVNHLELLEASVLIISPCAISLAIYRLAGDAAADVAVVLLCQILAEVAAFCTLRTEESRYIFPRAMLPVFFADLYYIFFHPFGFASLAHGTLFCFQGFMLVVLWSHFEAVTKLPTVFPDQLTVEVRLRPNTRPPAAPGLLSPTMQQLLIEQGLLLLGDDRSHESAVVMSAVVTRNLQVGVLPQMPPSNAAHTVSEDEVREAVLAVDADALAAGPAGQVLLEHAQDGDARCVALIRHLSGRLPRPAVPVWEAGCSAARRNEILRWLLQRNDGDALWVLSGVANARPHLFREAVGINRPASSAETPADSRGGASADAGTSAVGTAAAGGVIQSAATAAQCEPNEEYERDTYDGSASSDETEDLPESTADKPAQGNTARSEHRHRDQQGSAPSTAPA